MQAPAMRRETVRNLVQVHLGFALTEADLGRLMPRVAQLVEASRQLHELELGELDPGGFHYLHDRRLPPLSAAPVAPASRERRVPTRSVERTER